MIDGIEDYYQIFADAIESGIAEDWSTARIDCVFFPDHSSYSGEFVRTNDGVERAFGVSKTATRAFRDLRKKFKEAGKPLWGRASFKLDASGKFKMNWGYENCDESGFAIFDEELEIEKSMNDTRRLTR